MNSYKHNNHNNNIKNNVYLMIIKNPVFKSQHKTKANIALIWIILYQHISLIFIRMSALTTPKHWLNLSKWLYLSQWVSCSTKLQKGSTQKPIYYNWPPGWTNLHEQSFSSCFQFGQLRGKDICTAQKNSRISKYHSWQNMFNNSV